MHIRKQLLSHPLSAVLGAAPHTEVFTQWSSGLQDEGDLVPYSPVLPAARAQCLHTAPQNWNPVETQRSSTAPNFCPFLVCQAKVVTARNTIIFHTHELLDKRCPHSGASLGLSHPNEPHAGGAPWLPQYRAQEQQGWVLLSCPVLGSEPCTHHL